MRRDAGVVEGYIIGSGAMLSAGPQASIRAAALHAQTDPELAGATGAVAVDFESVSQLDLTQLLVIAVGWDARQFDSEVARPLLARGTASVAEVLISLARATRRSRIDLFAAWEPDQLLVGALRASGIELIAHPLEAIACAALITSQKYKRWTSVQAA